MRAFKRIFCILLALCLALPFAACGGGEQLEAPSWVDLDADYLLTWEDVEAARAYEVGITAEGGEMQVESSRRASYSLAYLPTGDYTVCVRSVGGKRNDVFSAWSEGYAFHRDYESGLIYSLINNDTEYAVAKVGTAEGDIVIGDEYRGKPVTAISDAAFRSAGKRVTSVTIGKNVRTIGGSAFYNCSGLKSVTIPDTVVSIGESAFQNCTALEHVELPASVTAIPAYTFAHCTALTSFEIGENVTSIGANAFTACTALTRIEIPESVVSVGEYAFNEDDALTEVVFGGRIRTIARYAFYGCGALQSVQFPERLADGVSLTVGEYAFSACDGLGQVVLPEGTANLESGCFFGCKAFTEVSIPATVTSVGPYAFSSTALYEGQENLEGGKLIYADDWLLAATEECYETITTLDSSVIHADTVGIADYAFIRQGETGFIGCPALQTIDLPRSVKYIGEYAFYNSPNLSSVYATRGGLERVADRAFCNCTVMTQVHFVDGLLSIGQYAFSGCRLLGNPQNARWLIPQTVTRVGAYAFRDTMLYSTPVENVIYAGNWVVGYTGNDSTVTLRSGNIDGIADYAFYRPDLLTGNVQQPSNSQLQSVQGIARVRNIGAGAFYYCTSLAAVSLNANVRTIEGYTFAYCSSLRRITMPTELTAIGAYAFYNCTGLLELDLSAEEDYKVTSIGQRAFYGCENLKTVDLGESLRTIGVRAFYKCSALDAVTVPGTVKEIGAQAFAKSKLSSLTLGEGVEKIGESAFRSTAIEKVVLPGSVKEVGDCAFYDLQACTALDLGNGVEKIGEHAFGMSPGITRVAIPACLKEIGRYAFSGCTGLRAVVFRGEVPVLGMHAFYQCPALTFFLEEGAVLAEGSWNSSFRPMVYGCTLSEDGTYVVSVVTGSIKYATALGGLADPVRDGFDFVGWATEQGGEARYTSAELAGLPGGHTLYAVYRYHVEEEPPADGDSRE